MDNGQLRIHLVVNGGDIVVRSQHKVTDGDWYYVHLLLANNQVTVEGTSRTNLPFHCNISHWYSCSVFVDFTFLFEEIEINESYCLSFHFISNIYFISKAYILKWLLVKHVCAIN